MSWKLTPQERRIIERTKREGEELHADETPHERNSRLLKNTALWIVGIALFALAAMLVVYLGTLL